MRLSNLNRLAVNTKSHRNQLVVKSIHKPITPFIGLKAIGGFTANVQIHLKINSNNLSAPTSEASYHLYSRLLSYAGAI